MNVEFINLEKTAANYNAIFIAFFILTSKLNAIGAKVMLSHLLHSATLSICKVINQLVCD